MQQFIVKANIAHDRFDFIDDPLWFIYSVDFSVNLDKNIKYWLKENMKPYFWFFGQRWKCRFIKNQKNSAIITFFRDNDAILFKLTWE